MPYTWQQPVSLGAKSSKTCAVLPEPASRTTGRPDPPQSSTSSRTPSCTVTNCTRCLDGSCQETDCGADAGASRDASTRQRLGSREDRTAADSQISEYKTN